MTVMDPSNVDALHGRVKIKGIRHEHNVNLAPLRRRSTSRVAPALLLCSSAAWATSSDSNPTLSSMNTTPSGLTRVIGAKLRKLNTKARDAANVMFTPSRTAGRTWTFWREDAFLCAAILNFKDGITSTHHGGYLLAFRHDPPPVGVGRRPLGGGGAEFCLRGVVCLPCRSAYIASCSWGVPTGATIMAVACGGAADIIN